MGAPVHLGKVFELGELRIRRGKGERRGRSRQQTRQAVHWDNWWSAGSFRDAGGKKEPGSSPEPRSACPSLCVIAFLSRRLRQFMVIMGPICGSLILGRARALSGQLIGILGGMECSKDHSLVRVGGLSNGSSLQLCLPLEPTLTHTPGCWSPRGSVGHTGRAPHSLVPRHGPEASQGGQGEPASPSEDEPAQPLLLPPISPGWGGGRSFPVPLEPSRGEGTALHAPRPGLQGLIPGSFVKLQV